MAKLALSLLGRPRIERDGVLVRINRRKTIALLTYLAVTGESHHRDKLAALFWPRFPKERARAALRKTLMDARRAIGDEWIDATGDLVSLLFKDGLWLDVRQFAGLLTGSGGTLPQLKQAVDLYRSDFLSQFMLDSNSSFSDWQSFQAETMRKRVIATLDRLVEGHARAGEYDVGITYARRRLGLDPSEEAAHRHLMRLFAATGQYSLAARQYRECRRKLERDIGVTPDAETERLYRDIVARRPVGPVDPKEVMAGQEGRQGRPPRRLRAFLRTPSGIAALCGALLVVAGACMVLGVAAASSVRSRTIAVFLRDTSEEKSLDTFSPGMADALLKGLARIPRLVVRVGVDSASPGAAAKAMGVSYYLDGKVFRVGESVHVSLRLLDARRDEIIWAQGYDHALDEPLGVQESIAADCASNVAHKLGLE
jgi:DNA-binding SARP family transcriptional activator/TolB-like protein